MNYEDRTKGQLISELVEMRQRIAQLEASETRRKQAEETLETSARQQAALLQLSADLAAALDEADVYQEVVRGLRDTLGYDYVGIFLVDENTGERVLRASVGWPDAPPNWRIPPGRGLSERPLLDGQLHYTPDVTCDPRYVPALNSGAEVDVPLRVGEKVLAVLVVESTEPGAFDESDFATLTVAANQASIALQRAREHQVVKEAEARYRSLFDGVPVGLYRTTPAGQILDANLALVRVLGYPDRESLLAANTTDVYPNPEERRRWQTVVEREGVMRDWEQQLRRRDGTVIWVEDNAQATRDRDGRVLHYEGVLEDITERKRVEEVLRQHNRELELLNQAGRAFSSTLDLDQVLGTVLEEVCRLLRVVASSIWLIDLETDELTCRLATGPQKELVRGWRLAPGEGIVGRVAHSGESLIVPDIRVNGRHFKGVDQQTGLATRSIVSVPLRARQRVIGVLQVMDTEVDRFNTPDLRLLEPLAGSAAIAIDNARLVEALRQRTAELRIRNEELDAFAHTVAHDLQHPLGLAVGFAEALEKDYAALPDEELRRYLHTIAQSGRKTSDIVNELLLLSTVRKTQVKVHPLDMASIVAEALQRLAHKIEEHQAEVISPDTWPVALGYGPWVEEVWVNYLSNALKYGGWPPRVELGATVLEEEEKEAEADGTIRFWVRDNGSGIPPEDQARLFIPFTRLDRVNSKGHGLGLSIVQRIVEKLDGQVGVESEIGVGSTFWFTLPAVGEVDGG